MVIYFDSLKLGACAKAIQLSWRRLLRWEQTDIQVLDPLPKGIYPRLLKNIMNILRFRIEEAHFFTGDLLTRDGRVVYLAALHSSDDLAFRASESILKRSKLIARLNHDWLRNTVFKHIAGSLKMPAFKVLMQLMVADALGHSGNRDQVFLIVERPSTLDRDMINKYAPGLVLHFYPSSSFKSLKGGRGSVLLLLVFMKLREIKWLLETLIGKGLNIQPSFSASEARLPSLVVIQEGDLSLDRSYRTQPYWLFTNDRKPSFRTIVLQTGSVDRLPFDNEGLKEQGIIILSKRDCYLISRWHRFFYLLKKRIRDDLRKCAIRSVFGSSVEFECLFSIAALLYTAKGLIPICDWSHAKAFMTCENYMTEADAMQLIAPALDMTTLSYQYSNMSNVGPTMMTTADIMFTFSSLYHQRWVRHGIRPGDFVNIGYTFDTSFEYIRSRALNHRRRLMEAGAKFIICYFDESVQRDKFGLISRESHCAELLFLFKLILIDSSMGLVVKSQFQWNSPEKFNELRDVRTAAMSTGRYLEFSYGMHRNIVFPAEAALSADIAIGSVIGATAGLEAALVGVRCILLDPYKWETEDLQLYKKADILYPSMASALDGIHSFRAGDSTHIGLGDWSPIIKKFDPYRDGCAGRRMRKLLESILMSGIRPTQ
jgi:hypothetical protein